MAITSNTTPSDQNFALFEGSSIKQFIIEQLNKGGIFIDQQYLGSNLNAFIDIIAVMLQQLQFHFNTSATENTFATASLYENMNKLVSLFNYKPNGKQTSILPISILASLSSNNKIGTFLIPRYSFINYNKSFILSNDLVFSSLLNEETEINDILYQGSLTESDIFLTSGEEFQVITIQGDDERALLRYKSDWLFSDAEADATVCSYKQTTFMANMISFKIKNVF